MGIRFRKSIKLAPGIRMNFSGSGTSWTIGPRGASVGIGRRGVYLNTGIPGTGVSARQRLSPNRMQVARATSPHSAASVTVSVTVSVDDDGKISFTDANGNALTEEMINRAKKQQDEAIRALIQKKCDEINVQIEALGELHLYTPAPNTAPVYVPRKFGNEAPSEPVPYRVPFFLKWLKPVVARTDTKNAAERLAYSNALAQWHAEKVQFEQMESARRNFIDAVVSGQPEAMEQHLEHELQTIVWPRETHLEFDISDDARRIAIHVDLPEIEDMPNRMAAVPARGYRLAVKELGATQIQKLYMRHVHAIAFRMIGEAFAALPTIQQIILSGYSQRPDKATGQIHDEYLYSVRVNRLEWSRIEFSRLEKVDVVEALGAFEIKRNMTKSGVFKAIEPIAA